MIARRHDWIRLGLLLPLLVLAFAGRSRLRVDVENLAMKSVGTGSASTAELRDRQFGSDPTLLLLASPRVPEELASIDVDELAQWIDALRERPEVVALEDQASQSSGEHALSVTVRTEPGGRYARAVRGLVAEARRTLPVTYRLAVAGVPATEAEIAQQMRAERARILPIIGALLAAVLLLIYREPTFVLGALLAPLTGVFLVEGLQGLLGWSVDPVSALLGPAALTVGVASSVHVIERYSKALAEHSSVITASQVAARELRVPMLLTVATTVAGFLGLLTSPIPAVRRFAVLASTGVVCAVLVTLVCLPSLLRLSHRPAPRAPTTAAAPLARLATARLWRWSSASLVVAVLAAAGGSWFMSQTRSDSDPLALLTPDNPVRRDSERVTRQLGGSDVFELLLPPHAGIGPMGLLGVSALVSGLEGVVGPAGRVLHSDAGYHLLTFLLAPGGSAEREVTFHEAESLAEGAGWVGATATGLSVRIARDSQELVEAQRRGILVTLAALFAVMVVGFRSVRLGLLGVVPNVFPLLLVQGSLGAFGRPLTVASSMTAIVMLGLVVDDTIHLLHVYRHSSGSAAQRVSTSLRAVTRPIVVTTLVLCAGFSATAFGNLDATREFGTLAVATLVLALVADLWLLPSVLLWRPWRLRFARRTEA